MDNTNHVYINLISNNPLGPFELNLMSVNMSQNGNHGDFYGFQDDDDKAYK